MKRINDFTETPSKKQLIDPHRFFSKIARAEDLMEQGLIEDAIIELNSILKNSPD